MAGNGLEELEGYDLEEGKTYYIGASDSPDLIYIESLEKNRVFYRTRPYTEEKLMSEKRDIAEDLIKRGCETMEEKGRDKFVNRDTDLDEIQ
jgi:hypothetical protein